MSEPTLLLNMVKMVKEHRCMSKLYILLPVKMMKMRARLRVLDGSVIPAFVVTGVIALIHFKKSLFGK